MTDAAFLDGILDRQWSLLIGGRLVPAASGRLFDDESPVTEEVIAAVPDADPERVAAGAVAGMNFAKSAGQSCGSTSRLLLHESIADDVLARVAALMGDIRVGSPFDAATEMGMMSSRAQYDKAMRYSDRPRPERPPGNWRRAASQPPQRARAVPGTYLVPRRPAGHAARAGRDLRPGAVGHHLEDRRRGDRIANAVDYGLTASVWTNDISRAHRAAAALEAGYIWVNGSSRHFTGVPFGGVKLSGIGREESIEELLSYTQLKTLNLMLG